MIVHDKRSSVLWPAVQPSFPFPVLLGSDLYVVLRHGERTCGNSAGEGSGATHFSSLGLDLEQIEKEDECRWATRLLGFPNVTSAGRSIRRNPRRGKYGQNKTTDEPAPSDCSVFRRVVVGSGGNIVGVSFFEHGRGKKNEETKENQCTHNWPCICKKKSTPSQDNIAAAQIGSDTVFLNGNAKEGGSVFCSASMSSTAERSPEPSPPSWSSCGSSLNVECRRGEPCLAVSRDHDPVRACFRKGMSFGNGSKIVNSTAFKGNGGGIAASLCDITLVEISIDGNRASDRGGAVYLGPGSSMFANGGVHFTQNSAGEGGAVACDECMDIQLRGTPTRRNWFSENKAESSGTGAGTGGALWIDSPKNEKMASTNSYFSENAADLDGGAVHLSIASGASQTIWNSTGDLFEGNRVHRGSGGALAINAARVTFQDSICRNNSALQGGGGCMFWKLPLSTPCSKDVAPKLLRPSMADNKALYGNARGNAQGVASSACHLRHTTTSPNQHATVYEISNRDGHYPFALMHKMLGRHQNRDYEQYPAAPEFELTDYYGTPLVTTEEPKGLMASAYPRKLTLTAAEDDPISTLKGAASTAQKRGNNISGTLYYSFHELEIQQVTSNSKDNNGPPYALSVHGIDAWNTLLTALTLHVQIGPAQCNLKGTILHRGKCVCDGAAILQDAPNGGDKKELPSRVRAKMVVGYYNNTDPDLCTRNGQNGLSSCCLPCPVGADCTPCWQSNTENEIRLKIGEMIGSIGVDQNRPPRATLPEHRRQHVCATPRYSLELRDLDPLPGFYRTDLTSLTFNDCNGVDETGERHLERMKGASASEDLGERCCPVMNVTRDAKAPKCKRRPGPNATELAPLPFGVGECKIGYTGIMCRTCAAGYVLSGLDCIMCNKTGTVGDGLLAVFYVLLVFSMILCAGYIHSSKKASNPSKRSKKSKERDSLEKDLQMGAAVHLVGSQTVLARVEQGGDSDVTRSDFAVVYDRIKIVAGFGQIFASFTVVFSEVPWPNALANFSKSMRIFHLDFIPLFAHLNKCTLTLSFLDGFLVHMLMPLMLITFVLLARAPAYFIYKSKVARSKQNGIMMKCIISLLLIVCKFVFRARSGFFPLSLCMYIHTHAHARTHAPARTLFPII